MATTPMMPHTYFAIGICCLLLYILLRRRYNRRLNPVFWKVSDRIVLLVFSVAILQPCIAPFLTEVGSCLFGFVVPTAGFFGLTPLRMEGDGSGQWSPIPSMGSPNLEPLFPSEPSDPPAEPAASTSAARVEWIDTRLHLWKKGGLATFWPAASIALEQVVPTPQWAEDIINNSGGYEEVFKIVDWRVIVMPTPTNETAVDENCIFVILKDGTSIPAQSFVDLGIPKTWEANKYLKGGWQGKTTRVVHAFNGMIQSARSRKLGSLPDLHYYYYHKKH
jgi:hypothetical protein